MLLVGLGISGITIFAFVNQDAFFSDQDIKHMVLNSLLSISTIVVVVAILGIVGVVRKNCCMIFIYQIFVFVFLALFFTLGFVT